MGNAVITECQEEVEHCRQYKMIYKIKQKAAREKMKEIKVHWNEPLAIHCKL